MTIHVKSPGLLSTIQDAGRFGYAHLGISPAGAADGMALRIANRLVGNDENTAALEMTLIGAALEFDESCVVALAGGECDCRLGNAAVPMWKAVRVAAGEVLTCGPVKSGARVYLAVQGGFDVPLILGSASTNLDGHFGGADGRSLRKGDLLSVINRPAQSPMELKAGAKQRLYPAGALRVTRGPQKEWVGAETFEGLSFSSYRVSEDSNRSGLRLKGEQLKPREESQLITEGVALGSVQVPPDGQPIILFVDQQTTGGYPKIANVIAADMHRVGQLRPRDEVRFEEVTIPEAIRLLREQEEWLRQSLVPRLAM
jgi:antagonist of KipI